MVVVVERRLAATKRPPRDDESQDGHRKVGIDHAPLIEHRRCNVYEVEHADQDLCRELEKH